MEGGSQIHWPAHNVESCVKRKIAGLLATPESTKTPPIRAVYHWGAQPTEGRESAERGKKARKEGEEKESLNQMGTHVQGTEKRHAKQGSECALTHAPTTHHLPSNRHIEFNP